AGGQLLVDVDHATGASDHIDVVSGGSAAISGSVNLQEVNVERIKPGTEQFILVTAEGGVTADGLKVIATPSIVTRYSVAPGDYDVVSGKYQDLILKVTTDFSNTPTGAALTRNQHAVGAYFNAVQLGGSSSALAATVKHIVSSATGEQLQSTYDALSPAGYALPVVTLFGNNVDFSNAMMSCKQVNGDN